jgi:CheY-like chemotaxis protein
LTPAAPDLVLVDDDDDVRDAVAGTLEAAGYGVAAFSNGHDALECLRRAEPAPGLILIDLMMPVMDGWQFRERQLADPSIAAIPVVVLSARPGAFGDAAVQQLQKPIRAKDLLAVVERHCGARVRPA